MKRQVLRRVRQEASGGVVEFPDLANKNTGQTMKFEFQINNK